MAGTITYLATDLVAQVRTDSDLVLSQVYTDAQLATVISDAGSDLRDVFTGANQHYDIKTFDFTLVGGVGQNFVDLQVTPGDFQQGHSVDVNPTSQTPFTLRYLPNWLNRNSCSMPFQVFGNNFGPKAYCFMGTELIVLPAINAGGAYRLYYTPTWLPLMIPLPPPPLVATVPATFSGVSAPSTLGFSGSNWQNANIGDTVTVSGATHSVNNGSFLIASVGGVNAITLNTAALLSEAAGAIVVTLQPQGTRPDLPQNMNPWVQYIKTQACITVRNKRGQPVDSFEARLAVMKDRIQTILQERQEEPTQPPRLRGGDGWGNEGGGLW
jgi:hypothetical protein